MATVIFCKPCGEKRVKDVKEQLQKLFSSKSPLDDECCIICDEELTLDCWQSANYLNNLEISNNQQINKYDDNDFVTVNFNKPDIKIEVLDDTYVPNAFEATDDPKRNSKHRRGLRSTKLKVHSSVENIEEEENSQSGDEQNENSDDQILKHRSHWSVKFRGQSYLENSDEEEASASEDDQILKHQVLRSTKFKGHGYVESSEEERTSESEDDQDENSGESSSDSDETYVEDSYDIEGREHRKKVQRSQNRRKTTMHDAVSLVHFRIDALRPELAKMLEIVDNPEKPYKCKECSQQSDWKAISRHVRTHLRKSKRKWQGSYQCNDCCDKKFTGFAQWSEHTRQFICSYQPCGVVRKSRQSLKNHEETHKKEDEEDTKLIKCRICGDKFSSQHKLTVHKQKVHIGVPFNSDIGKDEKSQWNANALEDKEIKISAVSPDLRKLVLDETFPGIGFKCKFCDKSITTNIGTFLSHVAEHVDDKSLFVKPYQCHVCCDVAFESYEEWICHVKPYKCAVAGCKKRVKRRSRLKQHLMNAHTKRTIPCPHCPRLFQTKHIIDVHVKKVHSGTKNFTCSICGRQYCTKNGLMAHEKLHKNAKPFKCDCGRRFSSAVLLKVHKMDHTGEKPYQCEHCGFRTKTKTNLREHQYRHSDTKPYKCEFCGKQMSSRTFYRRHKLVHTRAKILKCHYCDARFTYRETRIRHERIHPESKGTRFVCTVCGKDLITKHKLEQHSLIHTGAKPYGCKLCEFRTNRVDSLRTHQKQHSKTGQKASQSTETVKSNVVNTERQNDTHREKLRDVNQNVQDFHAERQNFGLQNDVNDIYTERRNLALQGEFPAHLEAQSVAAYMVL